MAHATFTSNSSRAAGTDAGNEGSDTATTVTFAGTPDVTSIGVRGIGATLQEYFDGRISVIAVYNRVLNGTELTELLTVQPQSASTYGDCLALWDFRVNDGDILKNKKNPGTYDMTAYNTPTYQNDDPTLGTGGGNLVGLRARSVPGMNQISSRFGRGW